MNSASDPHETGQSDSVRARKRLKKDLKVSTQAAKNAKKHTQRMIIVFYCMGLLAVGVTIMLYSAVLNAKRLQPTYVIFFTIILIISVFGMFYVLYFVFKNRKASIEAVEMSGVVPEKVSYSLGAEASNLYLRIGLLLFCVMAVTVEICRAIEYSLIRNETPLAVISTIGRVFFFVVQTIFLLVLHRLVLLSNNNLFSFILLHVTTTNICLWTDALVREILGGSQHASGQLQDNSTSQQMNTDLSNAIISYFMPAIPEHCAIAAVMFYELATRVGMIKQIKARKKKAVENPIPQGKQTNIVKFVGVVLVTLVISLVLLLELGKFLSYFQRILIHICEVGIVQVACIALTILGVVRVRRLKFCVNFAKNSLDQTLLMITVLLSIGFFIGSIIVCCYHLGRSKVNVDVQLLLILQLIVLWFEVFEIFLQTYFILDMFYRCCHHEQYQKAKPGRKAIALLAALNFALWTLDSFQLKGNSILYQKNIKLPNPAFLQPLHTFLDGTLPMVMLYRYHSSVCFAICYEQIYENEVDRYEGMLKWMEQNSLEHISMFNLLQLSKQNEGHDEGRGTHPTYEPHGKRAGTSHMAWNPPQPKTSTRRDTRNAFELAFSRMINRERLSIFQFGRNKKNQNT